MAEQTLAQPSEVMFERNVGHIAKRAGEVEVYVEGIAEPKIGFLAGMDEQYLQVCLSKNGTLSNIRRDMIVSVDETGRSIQDIVRLSQYDKVRLRTKFFQKRAIEVYGNPT